MSLIEASLVYHDRLVKNLLQKEKGDINIIFFYRDSSLNNFKCVYQDHLEFLP